MKNKIEYHPPNTLFTRLPARTCVLMIALFLGARYSSAAEPEQHAADRPDVMIVRDGRAVLPIVRRARDEIAESVTRLQHKLERISGYYGDPPDHDELNRLWEDARKTHGR